jgi:hypothetical protein
MSGLNRKPMFWRPTMSTSALISVLTMDKAGLQSIGFQFNFDVSEQLKEFNIFIHCESFKFWGEATRLLLLVQIVTDI